MKIEEIEICWHEQNDADASYLCRNFDFHLEELDKLKPEAKAKILTKFKSLVEAAGHFAKMDRQRFIAWKQGAWNILQCLAFAKVSYDINGVSRIQKFTSVGHKDVESDTDTTYLKSIEKEQMEDLKNVLDTFGVDTATFWEDFSYLVEDSESGHSN